MTGNVIIADGLSVKTVAVGAQAGGTLNIGANSKILGLTPGTFAVVSNAGSGGSLIDVATNTGTVWSVGALNLRDNVKVNGDAHSCRRDHAGKRNHGDGDEDGQHGDLDLDGHHYRHLPSDHRRSYGDRR